MFSDIELSLIHNQRVARVRATRNKSDPMSIKRNPTLMKSISYKSDGLVPVNADKNKTKLC